MHNASLRSLATHQANPTKTTLKQVVQLLDYAARHADAIVTYHASNMILAAHSNASYLSKSKAQSRARGHFLMSSKNWHATQQWGSGNNFINNKSNIILSGQSWSRSTIHKFSGSNTCITTQRISGTPTTTHPNPNRSECDEKIKIDGHEIPLDMVHSDTIGKLERQI